MIPKLNLRNECLKIGLAVMAISVFNQSSRNEETQTKCKLVYWRILDIIFKLDCITGNDNGASYLNLFDLGTDHRLEQKFNSVKMLWDCEP